MTFVTDLSLIFALALILRFFEHKEYDEISDILKIPAGTVGTLIYRGKKALREHLNTQELRL